MPNRALQKLPTSSAAAIARTLSFTSALQAAAGRAWARCAIIHASTVPGYRQLSRLSSPNNNQPGASGHRNNVSTSTSISNRARPIPKNAARKQSVTRGVTYVDPDLVDDNEFLRADPGFSFVSTLAEETGSELVIPPTVVTHVSQHLPIRPPFGTLLPVRSRRSLWQNILYLFNIEKATLPRLMDYHDLHPKFQSTRSYNLLISLAIRHQSFGSVRWLFASMQDNGIRPNVETWKLRFRWMVRSGWSDKAWDQFLEAIKHGDLPVDPGSRTMLDLCAEFYSPRSRASRGRHSNEPFARLSIPHHRLRVLWERFSAALEKGIASVHPRNAYFMIILLLHNRQFSTALSFTSNYFQSLPRELNAHTVDRCLRIVHLQMVFGSSLRGLAKLYWSRKTMKALLRSNPSLRPTSTSLFLLLSPLKHAKRCGTVAAKIVREFKRKWGPRVEDSRVRRRLASLALKEGRQDILEDCIRTEHVAQRSRRFYLHQASILGGRKPSPYKTMFRFPYRKVYGRTGHELSLWFKLERRARRLKGKKGKK
ncbi:hypothetical protein BDQ17DRAFT_14557 [Cyathus striatus]|nr:hypothetical protein BDQ17DRAFT_14557 [Cyathus striatus]